MVACVYHRRYFLDDDRFPDAEIDGTRLNSAHPESMNFHSCPGIEVGVVSRDLRFPEVRGVLTFSCFVPLVALGRRGSVFPIVVDRSTITFLPCATSGTTDWTRACATGRTSGSTRLRAANGTSGGTLDLMPSSMRDDRASPPASSREGAAILGHDLRLLLVLDWEVAQSAGEKASRLSCGQGLS